MFQTIVHPTDFDEPSKEAFRVARALAQALGARLVVLHVVPPPAIVTQDGRVMRNPHDPEPADLWAEYRALQADGPTVAIRDGYGRVHSFAREDIAARVPLKSSLMPDPLALALSEDDVADIVAFLMTQVSR